MEVRLEMSRRIIKTAFILLVLIAVSVGCLNIGKTELVFTTGLSSDEVLKIDGSKYTLSESLLFLLTAKNQYETAFTSQIWEQEVDGVPLETYVKDNVKSQLAGLKSMTLLAKEQGVAISNETNSLIETAAKEYYETLSVAEIEAMNLTLEDVIKMYSDYALSYTLYEELTKGANEEISDSEAKVIVVQHIFIKSLEKIESIYEEVLKEGADFYTIAEKYTEDSQIEYSIARSDDKASELEEIAFRLATGEISEIIETDSGYHIIKCINDYDVERTRLHKIQVSNKRKAAEFNQVYSSFIKTLPSEFNDELWDSIHFSDYEIVKSVGFYEVYDKYLGE